MKLFGLILVCVFAMGSVSAMAADGATVFKENCTKCHKEGNKPPKPAEFKNMKAHDADGVKKIITREDKIEGKEHKKDFKGKLSDEDMAAVTAYVAEHAGK